MKCKHKHRKFQSGRNHYLHNRIYMGATTNETDITVTDQRSQRERTSSPSWYSRQYIKYTEEHLPIVCNCVLYTNSTHATHWNEWETNNLERDLHHNHVPAIILNFAVFPLWPLRLVCFFVRLRLICRNLFQWSTAATPERNLSVFLSFYFLFTHSTSYRIGYEVVSMVWA